MPDIEDVIEDVRKEYPVNVEGLISSCYAQQCTTPEEKLQVEAAIEIVRAYYDEQLKILKAIQKAGKILTNKLDVFNQYGDKKQQDLSLDDL